jgi:hypothetical protein
MKAELESSIGFDELPPKNTMPDGYLSSLVVDVGV